MKVIRSFLLIISLISLVYPTTEMSFMKFEDNEILEKILKRSAEYCEKLLNSNISFSCLERVEEEIYQYRDFNIPPTKKKNVYIFDYKLKINNGKIESNRVLRMENGKKKKETQLLIENKHIILEPVGILSDYWQQHYDYNIIKRGKLKGERVIIIEVKPSLELEIGHLSGKIWVSYADFSILKIELVQDSFGDLEKDSIFKELMLKPRTIFTLEYQLYRNGIRFPTSYTVKRIFTGQKGKRFSKFQMKVLYKYYKFL